ncbi:MAG TPA: NAD-dependent epimerase/dehydratase family protein [Planctomycetota bacterium]|nr:NAD-dependent epimerase/dehydratase family protein [Planctomycetota bacterium]
MSRRILVTGGCGLIGSAVVERVLAAGGRALVLDNLSTGKPGNLLKDPRVELTVGDVCDDALVQSLVRRSDAVAHLAAGVGVRLVLSRPTGALRQSLLGTENVLRHAAAGRRPVFYASTSEVYGDSDGEPLAETRPLGFGAPDRLRFSYAAGKAAGEALAFAYAHEYGLPVAVGRFFNVTGARQSPDGGAVLPTFARQALAGSTITLHGDGSQTRCFLDARDAAEYVWRLLDAATAPGTLVNIGHDEPVTILDLARRVRDLVDPRVRIEATPPRYGAGFVPIRHRRPDVRRLRGLTGHHPQVPLDETIRSCVLVARAAR